MEESIQVDSKKPRMTDVDDGGEDIITGLPENIISRILSLLPTKDVIRTCVLSKDWEYKWTDIDNIDINDNERFSLKTTRKTSVVNFVDRIFILSRNSKLKRFRFLCKQKYDARRMTTWISAALMRNVEDLEITYTYEGIVIPRCIFDCMSMTTLRLQLPCSFRPVRNWSANLKVLHLAKVEIFNEHAPDSSQLLFNFPVLETFKLDRCKWFKVNSVEINAPSLTEFKAIEQISDHPEVDSVQIKISGAKLVKFGLYGSFLGKFDLSTSSVFCVSVDFLKYPNDLQGVQKNGSHARLLLTGCSGLNHLKLSGDAVEAIVQSKRGLPLPIFIMLNQLEILSRCDTEAFMGFLHLTPSLQRITLNMWLWRDYDYDLVESMPSCIVSCLNEVHFVGSKGELPHIHLADFFLRNAIELKKMSGLSRKRSEERRAEKNFWVRLKGLFANGVLEVGSSGKIMADMEDFERSFGT